MRLRNVKYAKELLHSYPDYMILKPKHYKGQWNQLFGEKKPLHVEIGCGKGKFIYDLALSNPNNHYIGIEKFDSVIVRALEKVILKPLNHIKLVRFDATHILEVFEAREVQHLYLNFSDPWPKIRHAKRRLSSPEFIKKYHHILSEDGFIEMKTDNYSLFEYSMMTFNDSSDFRIIETSLDLYQNLPSNNIQTEFEIKFVEEGKSIYYLKVQHTRRKK